jgi:tRNA pseudouridine38-40 synthase
MLKRYFIELAYNGRSFHGWQIQPNASTVQEILQIALELLIKQKSELVGCGRTDTGVHARSFFAHCDMDLELANMEAAQLKFKLNRLLPKDLVIFRIFQVNTKAHSRFDAISRTYEYRLRTDKYPFQQDTTYRAPNRQFDFHLMNQAASVLFDYTDFTSFSKTGTDVKTNNCTILRANWEHSDDVWVFTIQADRFLRNMVRAIVGTLLDVGTGKITIHKFKQIIESKNRSKAGWSVPAHGLALVKLEYPDWVFECD